MSSLPSSSSFPPPSTASEIAVASEPRRIARQATDGASRSLPGPSSLGSRGRAPARLPPAQPSGAPRRAFPARASSADSFLPGEKRHKGDNRGFHGSLGRRPRAQRSQSLGAPDAERQGLLGAGSRQSALSRAVLDEQRKRSEAQRLARAAAAAAKERRKRDIEEGRHVAAEPAEGGEEGEGGDEEGADEEELDPARHPCSLFLGHPAPAFTRSLIFVEAAVAASLFVDMLVYGVVVPVLPELVVDRLKLGEREVGLLFASYSLGYLILSPLIGFLSDKYRTRRAPMLVGLFFLSLSTLMFGTFAQFSYPLLLLARTVQGCAGASIWSVAVACLADVYPPSALTGATSRVLVFNTAGFLLGPVVGGVLFQAGGMGMPFFVCTGLAVADLLCWIVIDLEGARREAVRAAEEEEAEKEAAADKAVLAGMPTKGAGEDTTPAPDDILAGEVAAEDADDAATPGDPASRKRKDLVVRVGETSDTFIDPRTQEADDDGAADEGGGTPGEEDDAEEGDDEAEPEKPGVGTLVLRLLLRPELLVVFAASAVDATLFSGIEPTLPVHLSRRFGASPSTVGLLFIAIEVPNSLVRLVLGPVCDRMSSRGRRFLSAAGLALFGLSAPLTGLVAPPAAVGWVALPLLAFGAAESAYSTPIYAEIAGIVREHAGGEGYGTMYAMWNVCYSAGMLAGPVLCSHLAETAGFAAMLLYVGGATAALGLLVFVVFWMLPSAAEGEEEGEEAVSPAGSGAVGERTPLLGH